MTEPDDSRRGMLMSERDLASCTCRRLGARDSRGGVRMWEALRERPRLTEVMAGSRGGVYVAGVNTTFFR